MIKKIYKKGDSKLLNAWAFYDWANSVYPLVISSAVFPIYYGSLFVDDLYVEVLGFNFKNTALISFLTAFAFIVLSCYYTTFIWNCRLYGKQKKLFKTVLLFRFFFLYGFILV